MTIGFPPEIGGSMKGDSGRNLDLNPQQRAAIVTIHAVGLAFRTFDVELGDKLRSALAVMTSAALGATKCPYSHPPEDIVPGFDSNRNMFLHCLHGNRHCWTMSGDYIACP